MSNKPLVSIIINSYNGEKFIKKSIESALSQTYENFEIIFWDNKSNDNTEKIVKKYCNINNKVKYFKSNIHEAQYKARSSAVKVSNGDYFAFLDVDDWWEQEKLSKQIPLFKSSKIGMVCSNYWLVNERKNKKPKIVFKNIPQGYVINNLLKKNYVGMSTLVVSKEAYESLDYGFNNNYEIIGDYDLVLRLSVKWKLAAVQNPCSYYRWHENNLSRKKMKLNNDELLSWIDKMKDNKSFTSQPNFKYLVSLTLFYRGLILILSSKRLKVFKFINEIKYTNLKVRLLILLFTPKILIHLLRS